jgi:uncharacterized membrane protein YdbT with pleckstrin-like domain
LPNLKFSLSPQDPKEYIPTVGILGFLALVIFLLEQPNIERWMRHYVITNNEIIRVEGIITKKRAAIPFQSVADVRFEKGLVGRIFNFGTVHVTGIGKDNVIIMRGMHNPEEVYNIIRNKINLMRKALIKRK